MIAKDKFREGWIMTQRPFDFGDLKDYPIQKFTLFYAYSQESLFNQVLSEETYKEIDTIENDVGRLTFRFEETREKVKEELIERLLDSPKSYNRVYQGDIVQIRYYGHYISLYPDEYKIISDERLFEILQEDGYHALLNNSLKNLKDFKDKTHYLQSRGVSKHVSDKWASQTYKDLVYYKPYRELLEMFCRENHIYMPDLEYEMLGDN